MMSVLAASGETVGDIVVVALTDAETEVEIEGLTVIDGEIEALPDAVGVIEALTVVDDESEGETHATVPRSPQSVTVGPSGSMGW